MTKEQKREYDKAYRNRPDIKERDKQYRNSPEIKQRQKVQDSKRQFTNEQKEMKLAYNREYLKRKEVRTRINQQMKDKRSNDPHYKIKNNLYNRIWIALIKNIKSASTLELLGCTIAELKIHLEAQFKDGMTWNNKGLYGWHIDHIIPCASFDLSNPEDQAKCFHYTNLQPLWATDNLRKYCRLNVEA